MKQRFVNERCEYIIVYLYTHTARVERRDFRVNDSHVAPHLNVGSLTSSVMAYFGQALFLWNHRRMCQ